MPHLPAPAFLLALTACAVYGCVLWSLDVYKAPEVRHWERLATLRGLQGSRGLADRLGDRLPALRRLRTEVDIGLLLLISGSGQSSESWLVETAAWAIGSAAVAAGLDGVVLVIGGNLPFPLGVGALVIPATVTARYLGLRRQARRRQARVGAQLADALLGLAVLVPGIPPEDALGMLARCQRDPVLAHVIEPRGVRQVLGEEAIQHSTRERYWLIGRTLRVPLFQELSQLMRSIEAEGLSPGEEYPALSRISAESRLAQNRLRNAQARTAAAAAIALLLIPLLILVGGGIAFAFLGSVGGG
ncbi:MAG: hypothetical protein NVSMB17_04920 [Candidatus Dormibacteria bacterium]